MNEYILKDSRLSRLYEFVKNRSGDAAHDLAHSLRVARWTIRLGEGAFPDTLAVAAALLHDYINLPKDHPERALASEYSAGEAGKLLPPLGFSAEETDAISDAIRDHSFSRGRVPKSALGKALQDADRLEALGAIGLMRVFSTGVKLGASYFHAEDPFGKSRPLDDKKYSVDHFYTKLLKLPETMNTPRGREEAKARAESLRNFLKDLGREIGEEPRL